MTFFSGTVKDPVFDVWSTVPGGGTEDKDDHFYSSNGSAPNLSSCDHTGQSPNTVKRTAE